MQVPTQEAALQQLGAVPGVVGSMVFDRAGAVVAAAFPPVFDRAGLAQLATQLSADAWFQRWVAGEQGALDLRYADGQVMIRSLEGAWLLALCTSQANGQLLGMSLTQVVRRLRVAGPGAARSAPPPSPAERLCAIVRAELGAHAAQALEIIGAAGTGRKDLLRATADVEKLTRLFISKKKADEIGERLRATLVDEGR
jgi:predicted regulator of Ras-like GTPase activity (Roadblock/LC7/MglB family)